MFPLRDNIPSRTIPYVNYGLIGCCVVAFLMQLRVTIDSESRDGRGEIEQTLSADAPIERYGMIPQRVFHPEQRVILREVRRVVTPRGIQLVELRREAAPAAVPPWLTLVTCIFLHGGWMHFLGNMWFLHIFGDNVEDRMGHLPYLLFYLGAGVAASLTHLLTNSQSTMPTIGASGAIAGVMGAYLCLYPRAQVLAIVPILIFIQTIVVPAPVFLGLWFLMQLFQGVSSVAGSPAQGVAWWAHIGGFIAGVGAVQLLRTSHVLHPQVVERLPGTDGPSFRLISRR